MGNIIMRIGIAVAILSGMSVILDYMKLEINIKVFSMIATNVKVIIMCCSLGAIGLGWFISSKEGQN